MMIRAAVGSGTPIIWTVFAPLMVLAALVRGGRDAMLALARAEPAATEHALEALTATLADYARACVDAGADGLFYATNVATRGAVSPEECRRWHRRFDLRILEEAAGAPFNLLHVCGSGVHFDQFADYPVTAFSWATVEGNPSLREGHARTGRAVVGGLPAKPDIAAMSGEDIARRTRAAIAAMNGRHLLLGPDCSVNPDTPEALFQAAAAARARP